MADQIAGTLDSVLAQDYPNFEFIVIDTGGFEPTAESGIYMEMAKQTRQAVAEADVVVFVVDARGGLSAQDHDIARYLRKLGKPTVLAANKAEGMTAFVEKRPPAWVPEGT